MNGAYATETVGMTSDDDKGWSDQMAVEAAERKNKTDVDPQLTSVSEAAPNYVPKNAALAGQATPTFGDASATYAGAFAPNATANWADGWTAYPAN